jgi:hypothetical protein
MLLRIGLFSPLLLTMIAGAVPAMAGYIGPSPILVSQPTDYNGAYTSQNDTNGLGNYATVYDNFTLTTDSNIDTVQWVGSYFNPSQQAPITAWTVSFWADAGHQPGALLQAFNVAGNDGETFLQTDNVGDPAYLYTQTVISIRLPVQNTGSPSCLTSGSRQSGVGKRAPAGMACRFRTSSESALSLRPMWLSPFLELRTRILRSRSVSD